MPRTDFYSEELSRIPVSSHREVVDGVPTTWWNYGRTSGPVDLVLIHGFRGDHHGLEPIVAMLGSKLRMVIPDLPGFGASDAFTEKYEPTKISPFARWLRAFLRAIPANNDTAVLGHSFGSIVVAAAFGLGLPQRRCILVNPIATDALSGPRGLLTRLAVWYYRISARIPEPLGLSLLRNRAIVRIMSSTMTKTSDRRLRSWIHGQHDTYFSSFATRESVLDAFSASVSHNVSEYATSLPRGTLLIAAERDDITTMSEQRTLASKIPNSTLVAVADVGHLVHYEAPAVAAKAILSYVTREISS